MEKVKLNNGIEMPKLGIGTFLLTPDQAEESVYNALKAGYRLIDTANAYVNEKGVGRGIKKSGVPREEIFLALLQREYEKWIDELNEMCDKNENLTKDLFASNLAHTIEKRPILLKLLSMNLYDMEENSRVEALVEFKKTYGIALKTVKRCLDKFSTTMNEEEKKEFLFSFFPLMYGIYPYAFVTDRQKEAMKKAKVPFEYLTIYE